MSTRSRYRSFTEKEKLRIIEEAKTLETVQREEIMMWAQVVFVTGAKNKTRFTETNSKRQTCRGQKARHPELEERLCDYVDDKRQYGCAVTSDMCQLKALAVTKEPGITGFKAALRLCQVASSKLVPIWLVVGIGEAWQRPTMLSTRMPCWPLLLWDSL